MEKFLKALKERAAFFLAEMEQFEPFGVYISLKGEILDIKRPSEPRSIEESYDFLLKHFNKDLSSDEVMAYAIVLNGHVDGKDSIVVEIFVPRQDKYQAVFPYTIKGEIVIFGEDTNLKYHTN
ncbi:hypothetical protein A0O34_07230 [Chryseobacterium glaciei]|uniref:Uncharacterized protein n=1 Tax=Chryseobacterium glaciei TaxID=1685010 RepID=A0A172XTG7_9FLAO|nr:hypothetical protein [Chryseobacterium glaciei]ANF50319.1 hypothetical protein A0O34_07230 [Chryseobacterium glaciei]